jgi:type VI secretion system protein ImpE
MHVSALRLSEPEDLRDLVWMPGEFTWSHGGTAVGLIPTRYVGTTASA